MISQEHYITMGEHTQCDPVLIRSVAIALTREKNFRPDGKCRISFEPQIFWKQLLKFGIDPNQYVSEYGQVLYPTWNSISDTQTRSFDQYYLLNLAKEVHEEAAMLSTCWGIFQLAGMFYRECGYNSVKEMMISMHYEHNQLPSFARYLISSQLMVNLHHQDWRGFCSGYNGPDFHRSQLAIKMRKIENQLRYAEGEGFILKLVI